MSQFNLFFVNYHPYQGDAFYLTIQGATHNSRYSQKSALIGGSDRSSLQKLILYLAIPGVYIGE
ncbi:MAG: hypothetical protein V7K98_16625 [Nostoc sp.]|uniref:hypothetical protein n=1 Tax=Nostoc sp. TaxID=1180 RepID=UPI002FFC000C